MLTAMTTVVSGGAIFHQMYSTHRTDVACLLAEGDQSDTLGEVTEPVKLAPPRQSSAINFNAALGNWALPAHLSGTLPPTGNTAASIVPAATKQQQAGAKLQVEHPSGVKVTHLMSGSLTYQQDLRPRSSDGILQRITVDRGPASGIHNTPR